MKLIKPSFDIWEQPAGLEGIYKQIERAGRVCYKSEDKITEDSAKNFVDRMIKSGHGAMLEHGTIYLKWKEHIEGYSYDGCRDTPVFVKNPLLKYKSNKYSKYVFNKSNSGYPFYNDESECYVTTNYRVLVENKWLNDLQYICEPTEFHEKRITVKFICDRGVSHELVRHELCAA